MTTPQFVRDYLTGSNNIIIRKAPDGGLTKKKFNSKLLTTPAFLTAVDGLRAKHGLTGKSADNHPKINSIRREMNSLIADQNNGHVLISEPHSGTVKMTPMVKPPTDPSKGGGKKAPDSGTFVSTKPKTPKWYSKVVAHELDRLVNPKYNRITQPKHFSDFSDNPRIAKVQRDIVNAFIRDQSKYVNVIISGGKGGDGELAGLELAEEATATYLGTIANEAGVLTAAQRQHQGYADAAQEEVARNLRQTLSTLPTTDLQLATQARADPSSSSGSSDDSSSSGSSSSGSSIEDDRFYTATRLINQLGLNDNDRLHAIHGFRALADRTFDELITSGKGAKDNITWANAQQFAYMALVDSLNERQRGQARQNFTDILDKTAARMDLPAVDPTLKSTVPIPPNFRSSKERLATRNRDDFGNTPPTVIVGEDDEKKDKDEPRIETDQGDPRPPPPPPGTGEDQDPKPVGKTKKPKWRRRPIGKVKDPKPPTGDDTEDEEDDDDIAPKVVDPRDKAEIQSELRPFFKVGGEDILRTSKAQRQQEIKDWNLYSYVPGVIDQGDDNPLTLANHRNYKFRMEKTDPFPVMKTPIKWRGRGVSTLMRPVYSDPYLEPQYHNPNNREQWQDLSLSSDQNQTQRSEYVNRAFQRNKYPDVWQAVYNAGVRDDEPVYQASIMLASASPFR